MKLNNLDLRQGKIQAAAPLVCEAASTSDRRWDSARSCSKTTAHRKNYLSYVFGIATPVYETFLAQDARTGNFCRPVCLKDACIRFVTFTRHF